MEKKKREKREMKGAGGYLEGVILIVGTKGREEHEMQLWFLSLGVHLNGIV